LKHTGYLLRTTPQQTGLKSQPQSGEIDILPNRIEVSRRQTAESRAAGIRYRPDIDGLRGISIIAVILFHMFPGFLRGGYIGVDVFFVISGYLISGIIVGGLNAGRFRFRDFYRNRVKRILPALVLVVATAYAVGWFTLLPDEFAQLGRHAAASMVFVENFRLWNEAGYFDTASAAKPLMHLWSLSIEEQFYLVYPLCLWAAWRAGLNLEMVVLLLGLVSFGYNINGLGHHPVRTFFLPHARMWELMAGGVLACRQGRVRTEPVGTPDWLADRLRRIAFHPVIFRRLLPLDRHDAILRNLAAGIGLILILAAAAGFKSNTPYPGWHALLPVAGAWLVILAGPLAWCNRVLLADRRLVFVGLISYPLYLWHWPILSFLRIVGGDMPPVAVRCAAIAASGLLAWLTYRLVERPIRFGVTGKAGRLRVAALVGLALMLGVVGYGTVIGHGLRFRTAVAMNPAFSSGQVDMPIDYVVAGCGLDAQSQPDFRWYQHDNRGPAKFALFGDSKANALSTGIFRGSDAGGRWIFIGQSEFAPVISAAPIFAAYQQDARLGLDQIAGDGGIKLVVLTMAARTLFIIHSDSSLEDLPKNPNLEAAFDGLDRTVGTLVAAGKKVVITIDNPELRAPLYCISRVTAIEPVNRLFGLDQKRQGCRISYRHHLEISSQYRVLLSRLSEKYPQRLRIFDPSDLLCDIENDVCASSMDQRLLYRYTDHISDYAALKIATKLIPFVENFAAEP
jgi:peptidoglycan/LPS O-acetylase OafA/YrhL